MVQLRRIVHFYGMKYQPIEFLCPSFPLLLALVGIAEREISLVQFVASE